MTSVWGKHDLVIRGAAPLARPLHRPRVGAACPAQQPTLTPPPMLYAGCVSRWSTCPVNSEIFDETAPELLAQGGDAHALRAAAATSLARRTPRRSTRDDDNCAAGPDCVLWAWQCGRLERGGLQPLGPPDHPPRPGRFCRGGSPPATLLSAVMLAPAAASYGMPVWACLELAVGLAACRCVPTTPVDQCAGCAGPAPLPGGVAPRCAFQKQTRADVTFTVYTFQPPYLTLARARR